ncbi:MAG: hypothetical protein LKI94_03100 [Sporolactobacillus sp.]|nr:hypothetical protein [Sporolactobacillus sp.]MCI1881164.1 hypothetical protein [Sporolactobacillus sp.]
MLQFVHKGTDKPPDFRRKSGYDRPNRCTVRQMAAGAARTVPCGGSHVRAPGRES